MIDKNNPTCPECGQAMEEVWLNYKQTIWRCEVCGDFNRKGDWIGGGETMSDDDYALANFCHGGDLDEN